MFAGAPKPRTPDICANRHMGDVNSKAANERVAPTKHAQRERIFGLIAEKPRCIHDLETATGLAANHFSGRITELKAEQRIIKAGRCTHGSGAAIYKVKR